MITLSMLALLVGVILLAFAAFTSYRAVPWGPSVGWAGLFFWALSVLIAGIRIG